MSNSFATKVEVVSVDLLSSDADGTHAFTCAVAPALEDASIAFQRNSVA